MGRCDNYPRRVAMDRYIKLIAHLYHCAQLYGVAGLSRAVVGNFIYNLSVSYIGRHFVGIRD